MTMTAATAAPAIFKALMTMFQTGVRRHRVCSPAVSWPGQIFKLIPERGDSLKEAKNNPGVLQSYVTYDTLRARLFCVRHCV